MNDEFVKPKVDAIPDKRFTRMRCSPKIGLVKTLQILSEEYIQKSKKLSLTERLVYLEEYRLLLPKKFV